MQMSSGVQKNYMAVIFWVIVTIQLSTQNCLANCLQNMDSVNGLVSFSGRVLRHLLIFYHHGIPSYQL